MFRLGLAAALSLALAACGSEPTETTEPAGVDTAATDAAAPDAMASETPAADATETPAPDASASATPSPTASATKPSPTPTPAKVAAVAPDAFKQCSVCHSTEAGKNLIGPSLAGIYGEKAGAVPGFAFSQAMKDSGMVWTAANLDKYLADPKGTIPGNSMSFAGVKDAAKRAAIIEYIKAI